LKENSVREEALLAQDDFAGLSATDATRKLAYGRDRDAFVEAAQKRLGVRRR